MKATLWDGSKQLDGELDISQDSLSFELIDFKQTALNFNIDFADIHLVNHYRIYQVAAGGIEIILKNGTRNIFVVDDPEIMTRDIKNKINQLSIINKIDNI